MVISISVTISNHPDRIVTSAMIFSSTSLWRNFLPSGTVNGNDPPPCGVAMSSRALRAVALVGVATLTLLASTAPVHAGGPSPAGTPPPAGDRPPPGGHDEQITFQEWSRHPDWRAGTHRGTRAVPGAPRRPRDRPPGRHHRVHRPAHRHHPHLGVRDLDLPGRTGSAFPPPSSSPPGTPTPRPAPGSRSSCSGTYSDGTATPWYVMGRWASGDQDIRRTSVDGQSDRQASVWTDTFAIDDAAAGRAARLVPAAR